eukprot:COSAG02_NODE_12620_length_1518_cov_1.078929_3_plen_94_part_01
MERVTATAEAAGVKVSHLIPSSSASDADSVAQNASGDGNGASDDEDLFLPAVSEGTPPESKGKRRRGASRKATGRGNTSKVGNGPLTPRSAANK